MNAFHESLSFDKQGFTASTRNVSMITNAAQAYQIYRQQWRIPAQACRAI